LFDLFFKRLALVIGYDNADVLEVRSTATFADLEPRCAYLM
jgi:hypothetical protein